MYSFENDYDLYPANEGIGDAISDFFDRVWEKIQEFGEKVKEWAEYIKDRIKYSIEHVLKNREDRIAESSKTMDSLVIRIKTSIGSIQERAISAINNVEDYMISIKRNTLESNADYQKKKMGDKMSQLNKEVTSMKNMDDISEDDRKAMSDDFADKNMSKLDAAKKEISGDKFEKVLRDTKNDIGQLKGINDADIKSLKAAHSAMLEIFGNNNEYGKKWRRIMAFQKIATGTIRTLIGKIVNIYNYGMKCTQALASKIVKGKFGAKGETAKERREYTRDMRKLNKGYDKDTKKQRIESKNYKNDKGVYYDGSDQASTESAFMDMDAYQAGYEAAYEAAYRDAMESQEFYDSIPDAFEEFMSEQDDYGYDY